MKRARDIVWSTHFYSVWFALWFSTPAVAAQHLTGSFPLSVLVGFVGVWLGWIIGGWCATIMIFGIFEEVFGPPIKEGKP